MSGKHRTPILALLLTLCFAAPLAADYGYLRGVPLKPNERTSTMLPSVGESTQHEMLGKQSAWEPKLEQARSLLAFKIENAKGENLAAVEDLALDKDHGRIVFVVASRGGFLGVREKLIAIPYTALEPNIGRSAFILNVGGRTLDKAPSFFRMNWPDLTGEKFAREVYGYYGLTVPAGLFHKEGMGVTGEGLRGEISLCRLTKLTDFPIRDIESRPLGIIDQILIDMTEGRPVYALVSLNKPDLRGMLSVVPWVSVELRATDRSAVVDADLTTLRSVAYTRGTLPNLADSRISASIQETFGSEPYWNVYGYVRPVGEEESTVKFDSKAIETISGIIVKRHFGDEVKRHDVTRLRLKTSDGRIVTVKLCPDSFLIEKGFGLTKGDLITVTGFRLGTGDKVKFIAQKINKNGKILMLRDETGAPLFHSGRMIKGLDTEKMKTKETRPY
jgi:sporulation protein YlmC with PRC-barrel domain